MTPQKKAKGAGGGTPGAAPGAGFDPPRHPLLVATGAPCHDRDLLIATRPWLLQGPALPKAPPHALPPLRSSSTGPRYSVARPFPGSSNRLSLPLETTPPEPAPSSGPAPCVRHRILPPGAAAASSGPGPGLGPPVPRYPRTQVPRYPRPAARDVALLPGPRPGFPLRAGPARPRPGPGPGPGRGAGPALAAAAGRRRRTGPRCPVFAHSPAAGDAAATALARAALKRLRSLRHPNVLGYLDSLETEHTLYLVTEEVTPLRRHAAAAAPRAAPRASRRWPWACTSS
ncbi:basic proline-rich protein-like [Strigops habroptila]|uniref:basic proline-rich protein-like n=1 Tax=Strigops habroptila TaxID=2489341 RepID=UPI0011CFA68A|nr:basic proline-rich protein-like [Strigops habroptila]